MYEVCIDAYMLAWTLRGYLGASFDICNVMFAVCYISTMNYGLVMQPSCT
jgi:hypothetical protein